METIDLLSVGDASLDVFITPTESETLCQMDEKQSLVCFNYGQKIPVKNLEFCVGGNAANNAVGTKRLGVNSGLISTLGNDLISDQIVERLAKEAVDLTYVFRQTATDANYSTIVSYQGERTIFSYHAPRSYKFPVNLPKIPWLYLTSMGETFQPFYNHLVEWLVINPEVKLAFNPGSWQMKFGLEGLGQILRLTTVIFVNREEAEKLTGLTDSKGKDKELLLALSRLGPRVCIITDGSLGSFAYNGQIFLKAGILPVDAYERTGAGDAFGSGCLSAMLKGKALDEALLWGTVNSASVIGYTGGQKGLLPENELAVWLERARSSGVEVESF